MLSDDSGCIAHRLEMRKTHKEAPEDMDALVLLVATKSVCLAEGYWKLAGLWLTGCNHAGEGHVDLLSFPASLS